MKKRDFVLSILSGILFVLSYPPFDFEFLAWFAFVPLFYSLRQKTTLSSFLLGFITGIAAFLGTIYWIVVAVHTYGDVPLLLSILILLLLVFYISLYFGTFAMLLRFIERRLGPRMMILASFPWVCLEYLRSIFLTGFPWALLGHSQYLNLPLIQIADITGVYGASFVILLVNVLFYLILLQWPQKMFPYREGVISAIIVASVLIYGYLRIDAVNHQIQKEPSLKVGLVQGNIDQSIKWDQSFQEETLKIYDRLSLEAARQSPGLLVWPETATPFFFQDAEQFQSMVLDIPVKTHAYLLFGSPSYRISDTRVANYNSAYLASPDGKIVGKYDKIHLVPFGEYVPFGDILKLGSLGEGIGDFKSGKEISSLSLPQGKFGVLICFEIIFPDLCRRFVKEGANFLVTITNDAWFGKTSAPYQHFAQAVFRAVENHVFVARAANTGISGFIDPKGKILKEGGIFEEEAINGVIRLSTGKTFYTLNGDIFAWICSAFSVLWVGGSLLRRNSVAVSS